MNRKITKIIWHCSATKAGQDVKTGTIKRWHTDAKPNGRGWSDIGYHFVIELDGTICDGRPIERPGAHTQGHNEDSIGICYVGGVDANMRPKDTRTDEQKSALYSLTERILEAHPGATVHGHNEFAAKACPSFDVQEDWAEYLESRGGVQLSPDITPGVTPKKMRDEDFDDSPGVGPEDWQL